MRFGADRSDEHAKAYVAVYSDDELLGPYLNAARAAYRSMNLAPFTPLDLKALAHLDPFGSENARV